MISQLLVIALLMLTLDAVWLTARAAVSGTMIAAIQGSPLSIRWPAAALCYLVMIAGLWWFAVRDTADWADAAFSGAALGAVAYGVYDLTNYATLKRFPLSYALADWAWGTFLFAIVAAVARTVTPY
jgi:uncharacterized membrane protein